jgi:hypothetical protein
MQRDTVEHGDLNPSFEQQSADCIEGVQLNALGSDFGQVPAKRRRCPANAPLNIEHTASLEDSANCPDRWWSAVSTLDHGSVDCRCPVLTQITELGQVRADAQDCSLNLDARSVRRTLRLCRFACPIDAIESFSAGTFYPSLYHR